MRKQSFGLALTAATCASMLATPASAGWDDCDARGYGYYYAPRVYGYAPGPWAYRSYYRPAYFYGDSFYRPRVWGWRAWDGRHWGWRGGWRGRGWRW